MKVLNGLPKQSDEFNKVIEAIEKRAFPINLSGASDSQKAHFISSVCTRTGKKALVITYNELQAKRIYDDLSYFCDEKCVYIPPREVVLYEVDAAGREIENERAAALGELAEGAFAVASIESLLHYTMAKTELQSMYITFEYGKTTDSATLSDRLTQMGYTRVDIISDKGQFAVRGGIVDIFSPDSELPIRMELFGDDIDSLRSFDCESQLSISKLDKAQIIPVATENAKSSMLSYLDDSYLVFFDEPARISEASKAVEWEMEENIKIFAEKNALLKISDCINKYTEIISQIEKMKTIAVSCVGRSCPDFSVKTELDITAKGISSYSGNIEFLVSDMNQWLSEKNTVIVLGGSMSRARKITDMLNEHGIKASYEQNPAELSERYVTVTTGSITKGFEYPQEKLIVVSDREIFAAEKKKRAVRRDADTMKIKNAAELDVGDYVVHNTHGIGRYLGIVRMKANNVKKDYIKIEYRGEDFLYLPVGQLDSVSKYTGGDNKSVKLNRLGSPEWANAKRKVRQSVEDMAKRLVELYAVREKSEGLSFDKDTPWQHKFEDLFPYEETEDQLRSTEELKRDMEKSRPMDRLLCGDVGYGKTEVAMRGAFKAVMSG